MSSDTILRQQMVDIGKRMYERGLIVATDGNLSVRLAPERFLVTPSGMCKGTLSPQDLLVVDIGGRQMEGRGRPTSEIAMHLCVYRERPDVRAVIHAHPPFVVACTVAGLSLSRFSLPEAIYSLGTIPTVPYATPGTDAGAAVIAGAIREHDVLILPYHGSLTVGKDLEEAFQKLEQLEHVAKILVTARQVGEPLPLPRAEVARLFRLAGRKPSFAPGILSRKTEKTAAAPRVVRPFPSLLLGPFSLAGRCLRSFSLFSLESAARVVKAEMKVVRECLQRLQ